MLFPIDGADKIELAQVLGWYVVVKKGEFNVGDMCVYFEIDSLLPADNPQFDFLKNSKGKMKPLKTKKIRGVLSQGLVMPINILGEYKAAEDEDVTELLKVTKYEPPEFVDRGILNGMIKAKKSTFPAFIPKTDETRVQVLQKMLTKCNGEKFSITEKLDGTSFTAFIRDGNFGICSRNMELDTTIETPYQKIAIQNNLEEKFKALREKLGFDFALQGEIIGNGIQGGRYGVELECRWFNLFNIDVQKDVGFTLTSQQEKQDFNGWTLDKVANELEMQTVPLLNDNFTMIDDIDCLVEMARGKSVLNNEKNREGIVFRCIEENFKEKYHCVGRISFKAINPDFLLEN